MNFDRNTVIGFVILALLFFGYFWTTSREQAKVRKEKIAKQEIENARRDSIAKLRKPIEDSLSKITDSVIKINNTSAFQKVADTVEKTFTAENELIKISFTNKGGQVKKIELKKFKQPDSSMVILAGTDLDKFSYRISTGINNGTEETGDIFFPVIDSVINPDGSKIISFTLPGTDSNSSSITHEFILKKDEYMIDFNIKLTEPNKLFTGGDLNLSWQYVAHQQETDIEYEKQNTQIGYIEDGEFDYHTIAKRNSKNFDESVKWLGVRQRFFFAALIAKDKFSSGKMEWKIPSDTTKKILTSTSNLKVVVPAGSTSVIPLSIYYGPSDYHILKKYGLKMEKIVNLGQGIYAFVRPLNKFVVLPIFDFMKNLAGSMGLAIALLTIFIRLIISPLTYKSYLSGAKMKALRPEIAKLKEKHGDDRQAMSMDQMKLFREAGVNPLGGCIPALLQIPIFFALFSFFNSEVSLRGAEFLWANDLAAFDDPIKFGFHIPLLGSHLSLFNITAVITSFAISIYSMSMTPDQSNPVLKYMPYIFPIFLLFFFNRLPSALTWYYTVSNIITLVLQFIIQNYIIDHDKILAKIEETRKKPKTKSKWQERMEQMQEQQKRMKEMQNKNRR
jgi:YidC/Oxa1 family membrane protein insertase